MAWRGELIVTKTRGFPLRFSVSGSLAAAAEGVDGVMDDVRCLVAGEVSASFFWGCPLFDVANVYTFAGERVGLLLLFSYQQPLQQRDRWKITSSK